jgi:hypothetical protein
VPFLGRLSRWVLPGFVQRPLREAVIAGRDRAELRAYRSRPGSHDEASVDPPPHAVKVGAVLDAARRHGLQILIETGTFEGEMARKCRRAFQSIVTIELSESLAQAAIERLAPYRNIRVVQGDSAARLPEILADIHEPVLFWLDGHYSGAGTAHGERDTPLEEELRAIAEHGVPGHVVLIDDARLLGTGDYPTKDRIAAILRRAQPDLDVRIGDDIMVCERPPG